MVVLGTMKSGNFPRHCATDAPLDDGCPLLVTEMQRLPGAQPVASEGTDAASAEVAVARTIKLATIALTGSHMIRPSPSGREVEIAYNPSRLRY